MRVTELQVFFRKVRHLAVAVLALALLTSVGHAAASGAIAQSYNTDSADIIPGTLLSSIESDAKTVEPANNSKNLSRLVGVAADKPLLELSGSAKSSVQVVTGGSTQTLVSDLNGPVKSGDKITASPVDGIGMKADRSSEVIGTAQGNLDKVATATRSVTDKDGKELEITVGLLPVAINISYYSVAASDSVVSSLVPPFIQSMADSVTGRHVSPMRVLIGMLALSLGFIAVMVILYVTIRHGIVSLGRNPLAENVVRKGLVDALLTALGVLVITVALVYGILLT